MKQKDYKNNSTDNSNNSRIKDHIYKFMTISV